jgi:antitoxin (DNA-binding transcriptional repressor) of toxin-antitoxin stability system
VTIHVNIGEAKTRLSQLIAAALRGEEIVVDKDGQPQVRLVPVPGASDAERQRIAERRRAFIEKWSKKAAGFRYDPEPSMTDEEMEQRWHRKFGPAA